MIDVRTQFPEFIQYDSDGDPTYIDHPYYKEIYNLFGNVVVAISDGTWQGDSRILYHNIDGDGRFGYLKFGWGSCSGCDALQACRDYNDLQELANKLENYVIWFDTKEECLKFFNEHDWVNDYYNEDYDVDFVTQCKSYLGKVD